MTVKKQNNSKKQPIKQAANKKPQKKDSNKKIKSLIKSLESKTKLSKKSKPKDLVDKVLLTIMVAQLLFLVYYFLGY